jgi:peptidoglycan/xylan/chitin deacetylase (PgdA/CDA1 family)
MGGIPLYSELSPAVFEAQMRHLRKNYRVISLEQLCRELREPAADRAVAVTFDDGYRDLYNHAFPILREYQIPATVYLIANSVETGQVAWYDRVFLSLQLLKEESLDIELDQPRHFAFHSPRDRFRAALEIVKCLRTLPDLRRKECCGDLDGRVQLPQAEVSDRMLDWERVKTMSQGGVSFGAHTMTHPVVSRLSREQLEKELGESRKILEVGLGMPVLDFAFPFGSPDDCGSEAQTQLARLGYRSAVTTTAGINSPGANPFSLCRIQIGEEHDAAMFALRISQAFLFSGPADGQLRPEPILGSNRRKSPQPTESL